MQRHSDRCMRGASRPAASGRAHRALLGPSPQDRSLFGAMAVMIAPIRDAFSTVTARKRQAPPRPLARDALDLGDDVIELLRSPRRGETERAGADLTQKGQGSHTSSVWHFPCPWIVNLLWIS